MSALNQGRGVNPGDTPYYEQANQPDYHRLTKAGA